MNKKMINNKIKLYNKNHNNLLKNKLIHNEILKSKKKNKNHKKN